MHISQVYSHDSDHVNLYMEVRRESLITSDSFIDLITLPGEDPFENNSQYVDYFLRHTFIAIEDYRAIGYVQAFQPWGIYQHGKHNFILGPLYVSPQYRGIGVGHQLMQSMHTYLQSTFRKYPILRLSLKVRSDNATAKHLYEKMGYTSIGIAKSVISNDDEYIDCIEMESIIHNTHYEHIST